MFIQTLLVLAVVLVAVQAKGASYYFLSTSDCEKITDQKSCAAAACSWCVSGAVGSSCMSNEDAANLPSSVFTCTASYEAKGMSAGALLPGEVAVANTGGTLGLDISQPLSESTASCFVSNGAGNYIIPRGYRSSGSVDPNACGSLKAAKSAGIPNREVYMFPCPTCSSSAASQMSQLVSAMQSCAAFTGRIWLDIEGSQYWTGDHTKNRNWYQGLVDACKSSGFRCGVYSSASQWNAIFGSLSYSYGSNLPLWYAHYDGVESFSDFSSFGSWTKPFAKQFQGDVSLCSFGVDKNYAPNF